MTRVGWMGLVTLLGGMAFGVSDAGAAPDDAVPSSPMATAGDDGAIALDKGTAAPKKSKQTPTNAATKAEVRRRVTAQFGHLSAYHQRALGHSQWGIYAALRDGPSPYLTLEPPQDPPPKKSCVDCGKKQSFPSDPCGDERDALRDLNRKLILLGIARDHVHKLKQGLVDMQFYGGVANLVADIVTTTTTLVTAGGGAALGKAAGKALAGIALSQIQAAIVEAVAEALPPPLDSAVQGELKIATVNAIIGGLTKQIKTLSAQKMKAIKDLNSCTAGYNATLRSIAQGNQVVETCRKNNVSWCI